MSGNSEKDINKQLMELRDRYHSLEEKLRSFKAASESQINSLLYKHDLLIKENASLKEGNFRLACIINKNSGNSSLSPSTSKKLSKENLRVKSLLLLKPMLKSSSAVKRIHFVTHEDGVFSATMGF